MGRPKGRCYSFYRKRLEQKGSKPEHFNGEGWYHRFMQRHPTLSLRSADPLFNVQTTALTPEKLKSYFDLLETTLREKQLMNKPNLTYNMDESGMPLDHKQLKRIPLKGSKKETKLKSLLSLVQVHQALFFHQW